MVFLDGVDFLFIAITPRVTRRVSTVRFPPMDQIDMFRIICIL